MSSNNERMIIMKGIKAFFEKTVPLDCGDDYVCDDCPLFIQGGCIEGLIGYRVAELEE